MKLFPERYSKHINRVHVLFIVLAAVFLLSSVTWMIVLLIIGHDAFPRGVRLFFGRIVITALPLSLLAISLVIYSVNRRFHKSQSEVYRNRRIENRSADRADVLKSIKYVKYHYPFWAPQAFTPILIIAGVFTILAFIYDAFYPFGLIIVTFSIGMGGAVWIFQRMKKDKYVHLTMEGLSYCSLAETGFIPWNTIKEIRFTKQGYLIQGENCRLIIGIDIEPTSAPRLSFIKGLLSDNRYAKELIDHIQLLAPQAYYRQSFLQRDIFE